MAYIIKKQGLWCAISKQHELKNIGYKITLPYFYCISDASAKRHAKFLNKKEQKKSFKIEKIICTIFGHKLKNWSSMAKNHIECERCTEIIK
jgi:hypothetical protein